MLVQNGRLAGGSLSFTGGGALGGAADSRSRAGWSIANARAFGSAKSWPQGYNSPSALRMPITTGSKVSARLQGDGAVSASISAALKGAATLTGEGTVTPNGLLGLVRAATLVGEGSFSAGAKAALKGRATLDAGSRPSAFDIAQEVWQSQKSAYNATGTMGNALNGASTGGVDYAALGAAVWNHVSRTLTGGGATPTTEEISDAVLAALNGSTIPVNVKKVNDVIIQGAGVPGNSMRPV